MSMSMKSSTKDTITSTTVATAVAATATKADANLSTYKQKEQQLALLPLVGESILKKRHDLDDLIRKRAALEEVEPKRRGKQSRTGATKTTTDGSSNHHNSNDNNKTKKKFYVLKPETLFAHRRNQQNQQRRFLRVQKKGMQTRASHKPVMAVKHISIQDATSNGNSEDSDTNHSISNTKYPTKQTPLVRRWCSSYGSGTRLQHPNR
jgi:hypothetical protein